MAGRGRMMRADVWRATCAGVGEWRAGPGGAVRLLLRANAVQSGWGQQGASSLAAKAVPRTPLPLAPRRLRWLLLAGGPFKHAWQRA